jgi:hypothetical protein
LYYPIEAVVKRSKINLPSQVNLNREAVLASARLENWDKVERKIHKLMDSKVIQEEKVRRRQRKAKDKGLVEHHNPASGWTNKGLHYGKKRYECLSCRVRTTKRPAIYTVRG